MSFGEYDNFSDCVAKNRDKSNPQGYCSQIHKKITGNWPSEKEKLMDELKVMEEKMTDIKPEDNPIQAAPPHANRGIMRPDGDIPKDKPPVDTNLMKEIDELEEQLNKKLRPKQTFESYIKSRQEFKHNVK